MLRNTTLKLIYLSFFAVVILIGSYFLYRNYISADINIDENGDRQLLDFGDDIGTKYILLSMENTNGEIIVKNNFSGYCKHPISGFEKSVKIDGLLEIGEVKLIEISGPVGVHSRSKQFFYLDSSLCPQSITFVKDQLKVYNIFSDQPSFQTSDFTQDGVADFAAEYRNYDLNPLVDGIREIYIFDQNLKQFLYLRSENYQQNSDCIDCYGEIK